MSELRCPGPFPAAPSPGVARFGEAQRVVHLGVKRRKRWKSGGVRATGGEGPGERRVRGGLWAVGRVHPRRKCAKGRTAGNSMSQAVVQGTARWAARRHRHGKEEQRGARQGALHPTPRGTYWEMVPVVVALTTHSRSRVLKGTSTMLTFSASSRKLSGYTKWWVVLLPTSASNPVVGALFILEEKGENTHGSHSPRSRGPAGTSGQGSTSLRLREARRVV